jgi:hypothetical protein
VWCIEAATCVPGGLRGHDVALIVKRYALAAGLAPAEFSGHSLRAGFATYGDHAP